MIYTNLTDIPKHQYRAAVIDPPWAYRQKRTGGSMNSAANQKYDTMSIEDICAMPIRDIMARDSVIFLWATVPTLHEYPFRALEAWGYKYKTAIVWRKIMSRGLGYWTRGQVELLMIATRGKVKAFRCQRPNFIQSKARQHSQKPEEAWELINAALPADLSPRIELFAREEREGWSSWGFGVGSEPFVAGGVKG